MTCSAPVGDVGKRCYVLAGPLQHRHDGELVHSSCRHGPARSREVDMSHDSMVVASLKEAQKHVFDVSNYKHNAHLIAVRLACATASLAALKHALLYSCTRPCLGNVSEHAYHPDV